MSRVLILGAGTAGTIMANRLVATLPPGWTVTVVDRDDDHIYQPGLLLLPFGTYTAHELVRPRTRTLHDGVEFRIDAVTALDPDAKQVTLASGDTLTWDVLIVATGVELLPEETEGLTGTGWRESAFDFYSLEGSAALATHLEGFTGGHVVIDTVDMPIKCPVAPLEFALLLEAWATERGLRDATRITYVTPLDSAFTKPVAAGLIGTLLTDRGIDVVTDFVASKVDGATRTLHAWDGRTVDYDLLVAVPLHGGARFLRSTLGDSLGFVPTHKHTLQHRTHPEVFALGDTTDLPTSKAGAVAHFQSEVLAHNVLRFIEGRPLLADYDGHANCFLETGHGKAMLLDFNYDTEPLPGKFPLAGLGPFSLLEESRVNHWGKLAFRWAYWNVLLEGADLPMDARMALAGKRMDAMAGGAK
ncbi:MAG: sulfide:quinone oxidoreductase [Myxococcota bacterium]|jgi:sulfide:quinone oxidoreductase